MGVITLDRNIKPVENPCMGPSTCDPAFAWWWQHYDFLHMIDRGGGRELHEHKHNFMWEPISAESSRDPSWEVSPFGRVIQYPDLGNQDHTADAASPYWIGDPRPITIGVAWMQSDDTLITIMNIGTSGGMRFDIRASTSELRAVVNAVANISLHPVVISLNTWYMWVFSWDGNNFAGVVKNLETNEIDIHTGTNTAVPNAIVDAERIRVGKTLNGSLLLAYRARRWTPLPALLQWVDDPWGPMRVVEDEFGFVVAAAGANPHGPLGHPLHGALAGPIAA